MVTATYFWPIVLRAIRIALVTGLAACSIAPGHPTADNAAVQAEAAQEVHRICTLPDEERQAEIRRIKDQSGVAIGCGK